ncbi:MAG: DUF2635 domain-containing protein [Acidiphilium sp.]
MAMQPKPREMIVVKPGEGRLVRLPGGRQVPAEGARVPDTLLMRKWIANGDLVLQSDAPPAPATPAAPTKAIAGKPEAVEVDQGLKS